MLIANKNTFISAAFISDERDVVKVIHKKKDGSDGMQYVSVNPDFVDFQDLMKLITMDEIEKFTEVEAELQWKAVENLHVNLIKAGKVSTANEDTPKNVFELIANFNNEEKEHSELLFELKLMAFDLDKVENAEIEEKEKIRKATTPLELFNILNEIV